MEKKKIQTDSTRASPKQSYYNSRQSKKEICKLRHMFNKSCRGCVYREKCIKKGDKNYEDYRIKSQRN